MVSNFVEHINDEKHEADKRDHSDRGNGGTRGHSDREMKEHGAILTGK